MWKDILSALPPALGSCESAAKIVLSMLADKAQHFLKDFHFSTVFEVKTNPVATVCARIFGQG